MIVSRNPVYSALLLVLCFVTSAAIWILLQAEFLALVLVLVYVGAVMVLFLFVVMMLDIDLEALRAGFTRFAWLGWFIAAVVVLGRSSARCSRKARHRGDENASPPLPATYSNTTELGTLLYTRYVYPFEIAAMLLLVAIIAAIALTLRTVRG